MKKTLILTGTILSSLAATSAFSPDSASAEELTSSYQNVVSAKETLTSRSIQNATVHTVVKGDTLSGIAKKYGVTLSNIIAWNPQISNPNRISIGQKIKVSAGNSATSKPSASGGIGLSYVVKAGDTLHKISKNYGTTVSNLMALNPSITNANKISIGQVIKVKGTVTSAGNSNSTNTTNKPSTSTPSKPSSSKADQLIEAAKKYLGASYLYGASADRTDAFDCSSFTMRAFRDIGVSIPRTSNAQASAGRVVPISSVTKGDLVFFDTDLNGSINHVGIYMGNNQMIHASTSNGVKITSFGTYWKPRLVKVVRVL